MLYITLYYVILSYITLHYLQLRCIKLHYVTLLADISQSGMAPTRAASSTQFSSSSSSSSDQTKVLRSAIMSQPPTRSNPFGARSSELEIRPRNWRWHRRTSFGTSFLVVLRKKPQSLISSNTWKQVELKCLKCPNTSHKRTGRSRAQNFTYLSSCRRRRTYSRRGYVRLMLSFVTGTSRVIQLHQETLILTDRHV